MLLRYLYYTFLESLVTNQITPAINNIAYKFIVSNSLRGRKRDITIILMSATLEDS
jgi:hypothetical protein